MNAPEFSVLMPVYNAWPYLPEAVASLLAQVGPSFELLLINDGSEDESVEYLQGLRDSRIRIFHQQNTGISGALNRGLEEAKAEWIIRHDADDMAYPGRFQILSDAIAAYPDAALFFTDADYLGEKGAVGSFQTTRTGPGEIRELIQSGYLPSICHPTVCFRKERVRELGGYRFDLHVEDADLWWRIGRLYDLVYIPETTLGYRIHSSGISSTHLKQQAVHLLYVQYLLLSELWNKTPRTHGDVSPLLATLVRDRELTMRGWIRRANMSFSGGNPLKGLMQLGCGGLSAPDLFLSRCWKELRPRTTSVARNGVDPEAFRKLEQILWEERPSAQ